MKIPATLPAPASPEDVLSLLDAGAPIRATVEWQPGHNWGTIAILGSQKTGRRYFAMLCGGDAFFGYTMAQARACLRNNRIDPDVFRTGPVWEL
jgi:hypothetical protein